MYDEPFFSVVVFLVLFLFVICFSCIYSLGTRRKVVFTVKEKGTLTHGYSNDRNGTVYTNFMIYTKDNRAFKNVNSFWFWKWRSTELQAQMKVGKTYSALIYGWRIGAFNIYPNIVSVKEVKSNNKKHRK